MAHGKRREMHRELESFVGNLKERDRMKDRMGGSELD